MLLHFAKNKIITAEPLLPHLCTAMSNYDLISSVVNMRYISYHFIEFVIVWLHYRKATCNDVPWNPRSLYKSPFDEVLDHLKEYLVMINNKGLKDTYLNLQRAVSGTFRNFWKRLFRNFWKRSRVIREINISRYVTPPTYFFIFLYIFVSAVTIRVNNNNLVHCITLYHSTSDLY